MVTRFFLCKESPGTFILLSNAHILPPSYRIFSKKSTNPLYIVEKRGQKSVPDSCRTRFSHIETGAVMPRTVSAFSRVIRVASQRAIRACISDSSSPMTLQAL